MAATKARRQRPVRVHVYRAGDGLIIEPVPDKASAKRPARKLADADAVVCDLPVRTSTGTLRAAAMRVRLPRSAVEHAIAGHLTRADAVIQEAGRLQLLNLSTVKDRSGIPAPAIPAWLEHACERLLTQSDSATPMTDIARHVGVHPVHLSRTFARTFRRTMTARVHDSRVEGACRDLLLTDHRLADIAAANGFSDQSHLTRALRKAIGLTPTALRRKAKQLT